MINFNQEKIVNGILEDYRSGKSTKEIAASLLRGMGLTENQIQTALGGVLLSEHE